MIVKVQYFAALRDHRGVSHEVVETEATHPYQLYLELNDLYSFPLSAKQIRFVVNSSFVAPDQPLAEGDEVVFIPPVAGG